MAAFLQVWQCVDKDTLQVMDCEKACTVPTSCAVRENLECDSTIIYDTLAIKFHKKKACKLQCSEKSGTCGTPAQNLQLET